MPDVCDVCGGDGRDPTCVTDEPCVDCRGSGRKGSPPADVTKAIAHARNNVRNLGECAECENIVNALESQQAAIARLTAASLSPPDGDTIESELKRQRRIRNRLAVEMRVAGDRWLTHDKIIRDLELKQAAARRENGQ